MKCWVEGRVLMKIEGMRRKEMILCSVLIMAVLVLTVNPVYADTVHEGEFISNVTVPENGVIQYDVTVPAGSTVNYAVELTPDEETGTIDKVTGMWKNTTKKTVTRTITAKVKFLSSEYTISASYMSNSTKQKLEYKDKNTAVRSYEESAFHNRLTWDTGTTDGLKDIAVKHLDKLSKSVRRISLHDFIQHQM